MGYVTAAADAYYGMGIVCPSKDVTGDQLFAIVSKYLKANPEEWDQAAIDLVAAALKKAFPCKK